MLFAKLTFSALLMGSAAVSAIQLNERFLDDASNVLIKRQQFIPTTQTAAGDTCASAFGDGYQTCRERTDTKNRLCFDPTSGQTCCDATYACPSGSFCLVNPNCCPNGSDPQTCAADNGVSIAANFTTSSVSAVATTPIKMNSTASVVSITAAFVKPFPTANITSVVKATGTGSAGYATGIAMFTGAASSVSMSAGMIVAGVFTFALTLL